jgi:hypothetical protein
MISLANRARRLNFAGNVSGLEPKQLLNSMEISRLCYLKKKMMIAVATMIATAKTVKRKNKASIFFFLSSSLPITHAFL